jgi:hypothetical protein
MARNRSRSMKTADVAAYFGVTRQRVGQIRREQASFPRPQTTIDGGPVWIRAGIEAWSALHRPAAAAGSVFALHGARLLETAEQVAMSMGHEYVGGWHLWLAIVTADARVRAVFESLGATPADLKRAARFADMPREPRSLRPFLYPRAQELFASGAAAAAVRGSASMEPLDLAIGLIDADEDSGHGRRDAILAVLEGRDLDVTELRRRLGAAQADPQIVTSFEPRRLAPSRKFSRRRPRGLAALRRNPLGHDPWRRRPWGTGFALRKDERMLKVDGEQWFFTIDGDGFFVRTVDGRPVGYRWRVEPEPGSEPVNGFEEVLPMPPDDVAFWPDDRHPRG